MIRGYDKFSLNSKILLDLHFLEGDGLVAHDLAKPHHMLTLSGGGFTWDSLPSGLPYLSFSGSDFLECPAVDSADLNFTSEDFSMMLWVQNLPGGSTKEMLVQGINLVDGWEFFYFVTGARANIAFRTNQGGVHTEIAAVNGMSATEWQLVGIDRIGAWAQFYTNGSPVTTILGAGLTDPVSCAGGNKLIVGARGDEITNFMIGNIAGGKCGPRIWGDRAIGAEMHKLAFEMERHWFGV